MNSSAAASSAIASSSSDGATAHKDPSRFSPRHHHHQQQQQHLHHHGPPSSHHESGGSAAAATAPRTPNGGVEGGGGGALEPPPPSLPSSSSWLRSPSGRGKTSASAAAVLNGGVVSAASTKKRSGGGGHFRSRSFDNSWTGGGGGGRASRSVFGAPSTPNSRQSPKAGGSGGKRFHGGGGGVHHHHHPNGAPPSPRPSSSSSPHHHHHNARASRLERSHSFQSQSSYNAAAARDSAVDALAPTVESRAGSDPTTTTTAASFGAVDPDGDAAGRFPTELHRALTVGGSVTISQLRTHLLARPSAASAKDAAGRTPLHLLSVNAELFRRSRADADGGRRLDGLVVELFRAHPLAAVQTDADGRLPFAQNVLTWIDDSHLADNNTLHDHLRRDASGRSTANNVAGDRYDGPVFRRRAVVDDDDVARGGGADSDLPPSSTGAAPVARDDDDDDEYDDLHGGRRRDDDDHDLDAPRRRRSRRGLLGGWRRRSPSVATAAAARPGGGGGKTLDDDGPPAPPKYRRHDERARRLGRLREWRDGVPRPSDASATVQSYDQSFAEGASLDGTGSYYRGGGATTTSADDSATALNNHPCLTTMVTEDSFPRRVRLADHPMAEWSLRMLSHVLETYRKDAEAKNAEAYSTRPTSSSLRDVDPYLPYHPYHHHRDDAAEADIAHDPAWLAVVLTSGIASVPSLVKTILLLESREDRERLLRYPIVRTVVFSQYSVGAWIVHMLEHRDPRVSATAVEYLELVSDGGSGANASSSSSSGRPDPDFHERNRVALYTKIGNLDYFLVALLGLEDRRSLRRAASAVVGRFVLDHRLASNPVLAVAACDLLFHVVLVVAFADFAGSFLHGDGVDGDGARATYYLAALSGLYLSVRKLAHVNTMMKMTSWRSVCRYCCRASDLLDAASLVASLACLFSIEARSRRRDNDQDDGDDREWFREMVAVTIGLVWAKLVGYLYAVNVEVKGFLRTLGRTIVKVRWLLFVLAVCTVAFAQMTNIVLSAPSLCRDRAGNDDNDNGAAENPFCRRSNSFADVLVVLLGALDEPSLFTSTPFSSLLFVFFYVVVLLIMLSSLVASVIASFSDPHPSATSGEERLTYFAELKTFQRLVFGHWSIVQYCSVVLFLFSMTIVVLLSVESLRSSLRAFHSNDVVVAGTVLLLLFVWVSIMAFLGHVTFHDLSDLAGGHDNCNVFPPPRRRRESPRARALRLLSAPARRLLLDVLGIRSARRDLVDPTTTTTTTTTAKRDDDDDGRSSREIESRLREAQAQTKIEIMAQIRSTEQRMEQLIKTLATRERYGAHHHHHHDDHDHDGGGKPRASGPR